MKLKTPEVLCSFLSTIFFVIGASSLFSCNDFLTETFVIGGTSSSSSSTSNGGTSDDRPADDDGDGLSNEVENAFEMDPDSADTDHDGYGDGLEFVAEGDPLDGSVIPSVIRQARTLSGPDILTNQRDSDGDWLGDTFEEDGSLNPDNPDSDADGYADGLELIANSDPFISTDRPRRVRAPLPDGVSRTGAPPADSDNDGIADEVELQNGTQPNAEDTDGDGFGDGVEFVMGSDATGAASVPNLTIPPAPESSSSSGESNSSSSSTSSSSEPSSSTSAESTL